MPQLQRVADQTRSIFRLGGEDHADGGSRAPTHDRWADRAEHFLPDRLPDLAKQTRFILGPLVRISMTLQVARQIEKRRMASIGRIEADSVVGQEVPIRVGESPAPMVAVHELVDVETQRLVVPPGRHTALPTSTSPSLSQFTQGGAQSLQTASPSPA